MDFQDLKKIGNQFEKVSALYDIFDESKRLDSKAANIEFITTVKYIDEFLKPGMKILDLGAGTGRYSLYFAQKGYEVTAVELVEKHAQAIEQVKTQEMNLNVIQGNAAEILANFKDNSFDVVLCFGPLYHLEGESERQHCVDEIKRVCKPDGNMYFAFINNDMVITTETMCYDLKYLEGETYNHETFKVNDFPFVFYTVQGARELLHKSELYIIKEIASDGMSELLQYKINSMSDETYGQWVNYHFYTCEKPEFLGTSNHLLYIAKK